MLKKTNVAVPLLMSIKHLLPLSHRAALQESDAHVNLCKGFQNISSTFPAIWCLRSGQAVRLKEQL